MPAASIRVLALDADSFADERVWQWGRFNERSRLSRLSRGRLTVLAAAILGPSKSIRRELSSATVILGVGGGYLRGGSINELLKNLLAHWPQLRAIKNHGSKVVYLPQSVGPLAPIQRRLYFRSLAKISLICVRDDRSYTLLSALGNVMRVPDLAILELARLGIPNIESQLGGRLIVARELSRPGTYLDLLKVAAAEFSYEWVLQSRGRGNNDETIAKSFLKGDLSELVEALEHGDRKLVLSVRLHGSLQALLAGHPTVHLGYERKSWGAFEDLGISSFVVNARKTRWADVEKLVDEVELDESQYWDSIQKALPNIRKKSRQLQEILGRLGTEAISETSNCGLL
jgi:polysaccharide pyruvyl transferase WcaK-like protein